MMDVPKSKGPKAGGLRLATVVAINGAQVALAKLERLLYWPHI